jgi:hypothetical protein
MKADFLLRSTMLRSAALLLMSLVPAASLQVQVTDATNGRAIHSGVSCTLFDEGNAFLTDSVGNTRGCFLNPSQSSNSKVYELLVEKDGYFSTTAKGIASSLSSTVVQLSPKFTGGAATKEIRTVLSWGNNVKDLDAYLVVPPVNAAGRSCTVNYQTKT